MTTDATAYRCSQCGALIRFRLLKSGPHSGRYEPINLDDSDHHITCSRVLTIERERRESEIAIEAREAVRRYREAHS